MRKGLPSINATVDELHRESARGLEHGASPGSARNIMPGSNMSPGRPAAGGSTAGLGANPSRVGNPRPVAGAYKQIAGSPAPSAPPTAESVRSHSLALGGMKHMVAAGHIQPAHAKQMEAKSRAHIAAYQKGKPAAASPAKASRFGALGGMPAPGGSGIPGSSPTSTGVSPVKMDY